MSEPITERGDPRDRIANQQPLSPRVTNTSHVLELTSEEYHADPCDVPSLNSTTARLLLQRTPAHAKAQHPKLSDQLVSRTSDAMDMGTAVHQLLLKDDRVQVLPYPDWRSKEARESRDIVRAAGRVPMLEAKWDEAQEIAAAVRERMFELPKPTPFTAGTPETTLVWEDTGGAVCRARLDWLRDNLTVIDDLKVTGRTADPRQWQKQIFNMGYDVQAALYIRGVHKVHGTQPKFRWVIAETYPPYEVSVVELDDYEMFAAGVKVDAAISIWNACLKSGEWPGYDREVFVAKAPGWARDESDAWADVEIDEVPF